MCEEPFNVSVMDPRRKSFTVEGLQEDQMYHFRLSALTKAGSGPVITTTIKTSSNCETLPLQCANMMTTGIIRTYDGRTHTHALHAHTHTHI